MAMNLRQESQLRWVNGLAILFRCTRLLTAFKLLKADQREAVRSTGEQTMQLEAKRAQIAAFFLKKRGGALTIMELVKLMYLADRESLNRYGFPMTWDRPVSMEHGPVPSETYNCIKLKRDQCGKDWPTLVSPPDGPLKRDLHLVKDIAVDALDELSEAEVEILKTIQKQFGHMSAAQLRQWTHNNCPEWIDPGKSSSPIRYEDIFKALGKDPKEIPALVEQINEQLLVNSYLTYA